MVQFTREPAVRHRMAFIEDYDIAVARTMLQGCDVWLNNPRRPLEASGTSGQKAALNGALNCSVLRRLVGRDVRREERLADRCRPSLTAMSSAGTRSKPTASSRSSNARSSPSYYDRGGDRFPRQWVARIKDSLSTLGPRVQASRMVRDYVTQMYEPMAKRADTLSARGYAKAKDLAAWKRRVHEAWGSVAVVSVDIDAGTLVTDLGATMNATAEVVLGELTPGEVSVELPHGPVTASDDLASWQVVRMALARPQRDPRRGRVERQLRGRRRRPSRVHGPGHPVPTATSPSRPKLGLEAWAKSS